MITKHAMLANLPMYDLPELRDETDALWTGIARALTARGVDQVPAELSRTTELMAQWLSPHLMLSQTCGYPLVHDLADDLHVVATPRYRALGCNGSDYSSMIVTRRGYAQSIDDARGCRLAVNDPRSHSGMNALRALVAERAGGAAFFSEVAVTGSHASSMELVAAGGADIASIDSVTFALVGDVRPSLIRELDVVAQTDHVPGLPYISSSAWAAEHLDDMRAAVFDALGDRRLSGVRRRLRLCGADVRPVADYAPLLAAETRATDLGYPALR